MNDSTEARSNDEDWDAAKVALIADRQAVEQFMLRTAGLVPQRCETGRHADWWMRAIGRYRRISCPWCDLAAERARADNAEAALGKLQDKYDTFCDNSEYSPMIVVTCEAWDRTAAAEAALAAERAKVAAALARFAEEAADAKAGEEYAGESDDGVMLRAESARRFAWEQASRILTATPPKDHHSQK